MLVASAESKLLDITNAQGSSTQGIIIQSVNSSQLYPLSCKRDTWQTSPELQARRLESSNLKMIFGNEL